MGISASGFPLEIGPPGEPNPDTYMDVEPTQEELEEEEEICRQTEKMKRGREYLKEIQRMMDYEKRRLERLEKAATSKRQMEQKVAKICSNPFATFQKEKKENQKNG